MSDGGNRQTGEQKTKRGTNASSLANLTGGSRKGVPNKTTALLKDAILQAAEEAGGEEGLVGYLKSVAVAKPESFIPLLGKVLPTQVTGEDGGAILIANITEDREVLHKFIDGLAVRHHAETVQ